MAAPDWLSGLYFFRVPDLRDEVRIQISEANAWPVYVAILALLHDKARRGAHKAAAKAGTLAGVGFKGLARAAGVNRAKARRNVKSLESLGLVTVSKAKPTPGRTGALVFTVTLSPDHMRPKSPKRRVKKKKVMGCAAHPIKPSDGGHGAPPSIEGISLKGNTTTEEPNGSALEGSPLALKKSLTPAERAALHDARIAALRDERLAKLAARAS